MRALRYILPTYIRQDFGNILNISIWLLWYIITVIDAASGRRPFHEGIASSWNIIAVSFILLTFFLSGHMKRLTATHYGALLPHYRRKQLAAFCIIMTPLLIIPVVTAGMLGYPPGDYFAMLLFCASLSIWLIFVPTNAGFDMLLSFVPYWIVYELLDFEPNTAFIGSFTEITGISSGAVFPATLIIASCALFGHFAVRFLRQSEENPQFIEKVNADPGFGMYDRIDAVTARLVFSNLERLIGKIRSQSASRFTLARLYQYSLFNPSSATVTGLPLAVLLAAALIIGGMITAFGVSDGYIEKYFFTALLLLYHWTAVMFTLEFLNHRSRLAFLWLRPNAPSRKAFAGTVLAAYLLSSVKQYVKISLSFLLLIYLLSAQTLISLPQFLLTGLALFVLLPACSLAFSRRVTSRGGLGWVLTNGMITGLFANFYYHFWHLLDSSPASWAVILTLWLVSVLLLPLAVRRFADTELAFTSTESGG